MNLEVVNRDYLSSAQVVAKLEQMLPLSSADALEKTTVMEKQPELTDMLNELLIIVRRCGDISIVSDYVSSVESFPIGHVVMKSRKQEREDKKRRKSKRPCNERAVQNKDAKATRGNADDPNVLSTEDQEIKALEAKLGLSSSSVKKSDTALKKLKNEFSRDGLGEDFVDFLSELDHISELVRGKKMTKIAHIKSDKVEGETNESKKPEDGLEMDENTRQEMELLQAEDAAFLQGMDELPTDESDSESDTDLAPFFSEDDEKKEEDEVTRTNTLRNQQLSVDPNTLVNNHAKADEKKEDEGNDDVKRSNINEESERFEKDADNECEKSVIVEEDIYGRPILKSSDGSSVYLPPHLRRKLQAEAKPAPATTATKETKSSGMDEQAVRELTRRINGQINRISESNMEYVFIVADCALIRILHTYSLRGVTNIRSVILQIEIIYRENVRSLVNEILFEKLLQMTCHTSQVMTPLIKVAGALVAGLYHSVGTEVGGFFMERLVRKLLVSIDEEKERLDKSTNAQNAIDDHEDGRTSKVPVNLMLFVMMLYNFGVVHCILVYDLFRLCLESFTPTHIELIHQILKVGGVQLRLDDADAMREMVAAVQQKVSQTQANDDKEPEAYVRFILDLIYNLKKSPKHKKTCSAECDVFSLKKWIGRVKTRCGNTNNALRVSLHELLSADENGRWWIVGGKWVGCEQLNNSATNDDAVNDTARENDRLIILAEKQHMNTDIRKKIFVAIMGAADCFDAYERLLQLHLKGKQEREVVRVLLHCCGQEKKFNKYYLVLAEKLCKMDPRYRFTFQLAFWDIFKTMEAAKPRRLYNQAQMLLGLILSSNLSLSCLKVLDFTQLEENSILFLRVLLTGILKVESELEMAQVFQRVLQTKKAQLTIDGLAVFFHQHLTSFRGEPDSKTRQLLVKRVKSVKSLLDQLAKSAAKENSLKNIL
ncbi:hypothetical protein PsorP6_009909 [Peronosclerospora sorghi]|uniref:Uncharacterized protein n=1 Tax=Peronosclerospora sorghi TaxID=230839 RepID=A0ACC0W1N9_9STRA|nr:hypothetical protein PsorP6_009909 [Peronosclerospora sorghi]